jgi:hypothetical protein
MIKIRILIYRKQFKFKVINVACYISCIQRNNIKRVRLNKMKMQQFRIQDWDNVVE